MSRIGKQPVKVPDGVTVTIDDRIISVTGSKGTLTLPVPAGIEVTVADQQIVCRVVKLAGEKARGARQRQALWGTTRARVANLVHGVSEGWRKELTLVGVGYRAQLKGKNLELSVGYSHPVVIAAPDGISFSVVKDSITVDGHDIVLVGQVAADIRSVRKPEPYKGKGIRYKDEVVRRKVGKVAGTSE